MDEEEIKIKMDNGVTGFFARFRENLLTCGRRSLSVELPCER